jgi:hypothetical protein
MRRKIAAGTALILALVALFFSARGYLGQARLERYKNALAVSPNLARSFDTLELLLLTAIQADPHPQFYKELGRLYFNRALAEHKYGDPALRDDFLDKAADAVGENILRNPLDAYAYFELGRIFLSMNAPLLTYAEKARRLMRGALQLSAADSLLNAAVLQNHLSLWDDLSEAEKGFVFERIELKWREKPSFIELLRRQWIAEVKTDAVLRTILMSNDPLWQKISENFK